MCVELRKCESMHLELRIGESIRSELRRGELVRRWIKVQLCCLWTVQKLFNPIPAGYLKIRIRWGGVNLTPTSKSHVLCQNMTNNISLESLLCSTFRICKNFVNFQQKNLFFAKSSDIGKKFAKKNFQKVIKYTFLKIP